MVRALFLFFVLMGTTYMTAQHTGSIAGKITEMEMEGEPLLFANVSLKNTLWSDQTNFHGNFEFTDVTPGSYTMVVTFLGYETLEFPLTVEAGRTTPVQKGLSALSNDTAGLVFSEKEANILVAPAVSSIKADGTRE